MPLLEVKHYIRQLCSGLDFCHSRKVMHRDLKPQNILLGAVNTPFNGRVLKIADFGLSRTQNEVDEEYTNKVVTLSYRSPEVILGYCRYGPGIDMWSVGCIMMELYTSQLFFGGNAEEEVLYHIFRQKGFPGGGYAEMYVSPDKRDMWRAVMTHYNSMQGIPDRIRPLNRTKDDVSQQLIELVDELFDYDPSKRPTSRHVLNGAFLN